MVRVFLGIAALMLLWTFNAPTSALSKEPALPDERRPRLVKGVGDTEERARQDALKQAVVTIQRLMHEHQPELKSFVVTPDYVEKNVLADQGHPGKEIHIKGIDIPFKEWILDFRGDNWWKDIVRCDEVVHRAQRAEFRQTAASRIVAGLAVLLLASFSYVRADQYTRGRYTPWLRAGGAGVVSLVLAGWWWALHGG